MSMENSKSSGGTTMEKQQYVMLTKMELFKIIEKNCKQASCWFLL
jgi:hypothetical protein